VDENNAEHEQFASSLRDELIQLIEHKLTATTSDDMFLPRLKLQQTVIQFRQMYSTHPMNLVRVVNSCLCTEMRLVQAANNVCSACIRFSSFCCCASVEVWSIVINPSLCVSVCLSVCPRAYPWNRWTDLCEIGLLCADPLARSSSGGVALRYVRPVLWMRPRLAVMGATPTGGG